MASINKVILLGRLGLDPSRRQTRDMKEFATFRMATSKKWKDEEKTQWHDVVVWNEYTAKYVNDFACKGTLVYVEGELEQRQYEKDGVTHYAWDVVVASYGGTVQIVADGVGRGANADDGARAGTRTGTERETERVRSSRGKPDFVETRKGSNVDKQAIETQKAWDRDLDDEIPF